jgi:hypothetical protein
LSKYFGYTVGYLCKGYSEVEGLPVIPRILNINEPLSCMDSHRSAGWFFRAVSSYAPSKPWGEGGSYLLAVVVLMVNVFFETKNPN